MAGTKSATSFSDDDDEATQLSKEKSTRGRKASATAPGSSHDALDTGKTSTRGRGRGRGRGKNATNMKQTTLDASLGFRRSQRFFMFSSPLFFLFVMFT